MTPDILVMGVGRSGTTFAAMVLHEQFGVCFGHHHTMYTEFRGEPIYEDEWLKEHLNDLVLGRNKVDGFLEYFGESHERCEAKLRGIKLLDLAILSVEQLKELKPKLVVRCYRGRESCCQSWVRYNGRDIGWAYKYYDDREYRLREFSACHALPVLTVMLDPLVHRVGEPEMVGMLGQYLGRVGLLTTQEQVG